ncbi:aminoglycoside 6-adenylyltransferase [Aureibacillus halotolerans]|uniref:Aminoglycoside 6-adenylyltransferase n=1 Tax=Aureibacillus halotolerans TaxID=1508390 RepID=A0A4R6UBX5_9BACI|nr:aminoglycoside 6-adenylyltransferase [Aureibacillus halotolerans]TDQ42573.1 aminoglycoside 6-adenylyltransferase [Aureibacillus halotolerans]
MRTDQDVLAKIIEVAQKDDLIRAAFMNGSRVNPLAPKDRFQDFDIVYIVTSIDPFKKDHSWINAFGERVIVQVPDEMDLYLYPGEASQNRFAYLMQFSDGHRIDLTLFNQEVAAEAYYADSLRQVLIDKDAIFHEDEQHTSNDANYHVKRPDEHLFYACCNEFFWVSTYVAKGLCRDELPIAKTMMEGPVRSMLIQMLSWKIGIAHDFKVNVGKDGRWLKRFLAKDEWEAYAITYPNGDQWAMWEALEAMCRLFRDVGMNVAHELNYDYPLEEDKRVVSYLRGMRQN